MCTGCYRDYGSPMIVNDKTLAALRLIERVYEYSLSGGNLHCELDDWNLDDESFATDFNAYDPRVLSDQLAAEKECYDALRAMTVEERASALAMHDKLFTSTVAGQ